MGHGRATEVSCFFLRYVVLALLILIAIVLLLLYITKSEVDLELGPPIYGRRPTCHFSRRAARLQRDAVRKTAAACTPFPFPLEVVTRPL
jgi:hypothetical protein